MCQQYDRAAQMVVAYLVEQGFPRTARRDFQRASKEFGRYLERGCLQYSSGLARAWLDSRKPSLSKRQFLSFRRSLRLVEDAARNGSVTTVWFSYERSRYRAPDCYRPLLDAFLERRKQDGMQRSTLQMDLVACTQFLLFLRVREITDVGSITPEIVKEYQTQAEHHTAESSNALRPPNPRLCEISGYAKAGARDPRVRLCDRKGGQSTYRDHLVRRTGQYHKDFCREESLTCGIEMRFHDHARASHGSAICRYL